VVSFTLWPLYPQGKSPWFPLDRRLGVLQNNGLDAVVKRNTFPSPIDVHIIMQILQKKTCLKF
jgi:hypothetical protein